MSAFDLAKRIRERQAARGDEGANLMDFMADLTGKPVPQEAQKNLQALAVGEDGALTFGGVGLTRTGLVFPEIGIEREELDSLLNMLLNLDGSLAWMLGDALHEADREYGVTYQAIADATGRDVATLHDYHYVASHVKFSFRNENLSWSHHKVVAPLEEHEQRKWLDLAASEGWSKDRLRREIADDTTPKALPAQTPPTLIPPHTAETFKRLSKLTPERVAAMDADQLREARQQHGALTNSMARLLQAIQQREQELRLEELRRGKP